VGFQNWATGLDLGFYAARSYSLMRPPRTVWVPIIHPCWSGSMSILVEGAAESVPSADIEVRDALRIGNRFG